ncbi:MAG: LicD family protein [Lachnospiraceae bacterium]|jgi:lipopolysaccharide cholinephosphotransferase|nr:LicD family protein [Lachnospiraceae bacterium]
MDYLEYDPEELQQVQKIELGILDDFIEICDKNHISYFMCGGTSIGIAREGRMIPWDDDIDVGLLRKDYDRLKEIIITEYNDKYDFVDPLLYEDYFAMNAHICLKGTIFEEYSGIGLNYPKGIFLDIFPFDNISDDDSRLKKDGWKVWKLHKILTLIMIEKPVIYQKGLFAKTIRLICSILHKILVLLKISPLKLKERIDKIVKRYKDEDTKRVAFYFDPKNPFTSLLYKTEIMPLKKVDFQNRKVFIINNIYAYLKRRYPNWRQVPKEEDRHNHKPYKLEFKNE